MAIPKIMRQEEQVLLSTGLLEYPLSPLTLQETTLLDGPSSPSDCLIPACENLSLAPFVGPVSPRPVSPKSITPPSVPAVELGSDTPPSHNVPATIAPTSLAEINPHWESLPHVREVNAPALIEFKSFEQEKLDPVTGKIIRTHVIFPVVIPKDKDNACISVPPLLEAEGQINSVVPSPSPAIVDESTSTRSGRADERRCRSCTTFALAPNTDTDTDVP